MLFSSQSLNQLNALSAASLNASSLQTTSAALLSTTSSGLVDPMQQSSRLIGSGASLDSIASTGLTTTEIASTSMSNIPPISDISDSSSILRYFANEGSSTVYQYSGNTDFSLDSSLSSPGNLLPSELALDPVNFSGIAQTSLINDANTVNGSVRELTNLTALNLKSVVTPIPDLDNYRNILLLRDDTQDTARDLGHLANSTVYSFNDHIGNSDKIDFYKFTLDDSPYETLIDITFALTGLNAPATLTLYDANKLKVPFAGLSDRLVEAILTRGTYYLSVDTVDHNTDYTLRIKADDSYPAHDMLASEHDLGTLRGFRNFSAKFHEKRQNYKDSDPLPEFGILHPEFVTFWNANINIEQYHFNLASVSDLSVSIDQGDFYLVQDANNNGMVDLGERIGGTDERSKAQTLSFAGLAAGSYFLQVGNYNSSSRPYNLNLMAAAVSNLGLEPDDSPNQATEIGSLVGQRSFSNTVGAADKDDFYRFNLPDMSNLNLSLTGLSANADVQVIRDVNHNGVVDPGDVVASSTLKGTASESLNLQGLDGGFYFVRVHGAEGNTNYTLNLTATPGLGVAPEPNNTVATAYNIGTLNTLRQFDGFVGWSDADDYYRFTLGTSRQVDLTLGGMSALADLQLLDSKGVVIASDGAYSGRDLANPAISRLLAAGDYMVRVQHYEDPDYFTVNQDTRYHLSLAA